MIKLTNLQIQNIVTSGALQTVAKKPLPIKVSYWITKNIDKLTTEYKYFLDAKKKLIEQYGKRDDKGELVTNKETGEVYLKDVQGFQDALRELLEMEVEVDINPVKIDMEKLDNLTFTLEEMSILLPLIDVND